MGKNTRFFVSEEPKFLRTLIKKLVPVVMVLSSIKSWKSGRVVKRNVLSGIYKNLRKEDIVLNVVEEGVESGVGLWRMLSPMTPLVTDGLCTLRFGQKKLILYNHKPL